MTAYCLPDWFSARKNDDTPADWATKEEVFVDFISPTYLRWMQDHASQIDMMMRIESVREEEILGGCGKLVTAITYFPTDMKTRNVLAAVEIASGRFDPLRHSPIEIATLPETLSEQVLQTIPTFTSYMITAETDEMVITGNFMSRADAIEWLEAILCG